MANFPELNRIIDKLDKLDERLDAVDTTLVRNTASLEEHVRRTNLLEQDMRPIKAHVQLVNTGSKVIVGLGSTLLTLALAAKQLGLF